MFGNGNGVASLKGRVALVTGASRGIGRAIALHLAHRGAAVAIDFRSHVDEAEAVAQQIREMGAECILLQCDVSSRESARKAVETVLEQWHHLDILVNNAGITRDHGITKMTDDDWVEVINVNLNGTYYCTTAALPAMIQQKYGRIINISSLVAQAGNYGQTNYAASKGGIIALTKSLALELAKYNITVNTISPGFTCTEMLAKVPQDALDQIRAKIPLRRFADPEDIAKAAGFLAAEADYVTGQQLNVNGGLYM